MPFPAGIRPTARVGQKLEWPYAGQNYQAEIRRLEDAGDPDMTINGAGETYDLEAAAGEFVVVNALTIILHDGNPANWTDATFGEAAALVGGIELLYQKEGVTAHDFTSEFHITTNGSLIRMAAPNVQVFSFTGGNNLLAATLDCVGLMAPIILSETNDRVRAIINGDASALAVLEIRADCLVVPT